MVHARFVLMNTLVRFVLSRADRWTIVEEYGGAFARAHDIYHMDLSGAPRPRGCTLIVNALAKSLALTGMRVNYLTGHKVVINAVKALKSQTMIQFQCHCTASGAPISSPH